MQMPIENTNANLPDFNALQGAIFLMFKTFPNQSFTNDQIEKFVIQELNISETAQKIPREKSRTELQYQLAWARTKAKSAGLIIRDGSKCWRSNT
jgi:hypothetical protein